MVFIFMCYHKYLKFFKLALCKFLAYFVSLFWSYIIFRTKALYYVMIFYSSSFSVKLLGHIKVINYIIGVAILPPYKFFFCLFLLG